MQIWTEKYRPKDFSEIRGQKEIVKRVKAFVKQKNMPHQLYAGPAGVGKCVTKETPILTGSGRLMQIEDCFMNNEKEVMSLGNDGKIKKEKIAYLFKGKSDQLIKITTALGKYIKTTPEHPFLALKNGIPCWVKAKDLKKDTLIATPTEFCIKEKPCFLELEKVPNLWVILENDIEVSISDIFIGTEQKVLKYLEKQKRATSREISENTKIKKGSVVWATGRLVKKGILSKTDSKRPIYTLINNKILTKDVPFNIALNVRRNIIKYIYYNCKFNKKSSKICYFKKITPEFLEWLGMVFGDGHIDRGRISFTNKSEKLLQHFKLLSEKIFGDLVWYRRETRKVPSLDIGKAGTISQIMEKLFGIPLNRKKSDMIKIPDFLFSADKRCISSFIRGYYECDGSFHKATIEFSSASIRMIHGLSYLLLVFGITSKIRQKKNQFYLSISGGLDVANFREKIKPVFKKIDYVKEPNTNIDILEINHEILNNIMVNLGIRQIDLGKKKEIEYIFGRKRGGRIKIRGLYKKICLIAREKISNALETSVLLNNLKTDVTRDIDNVFTYLNSSKVRTMVDEQTGIRYDRLNEYYDKKREPTLDNLMKIIKGLYLLKKTDNMELYDKITKIFLIRAKIVKTIQQLNIPYNELSEYSNVSTGNIHFYLNNDWGLSIKAIKKIGSVFTAVKQVIEQRIINDQLVSDLETIEFLSKAQIRWDRIRSTKQIKGDIVYDLNVENTHNFIGGHGALVLHNSSLALVVARQLFGDSWRENLLDLNASDERGIDIIRNKVKDFARTRSIGNVPFKIIFLDEADALTKEAQQALRRTMENYTQTCRFILSANYSSKIIDPIQSRCTIFRFKPLEKEEVFEIIDKIAKEEKLKIDNKAKEALFEICEGDCRRMENILQSSAAVTDKITEDILYSLASVARPKEIVDVLNLALKNRFLDARNKLLEVMLNYGLSGLDVIKQIQKEIWGLEIDDRDKAFLMDKCGEIEFRMTEGSDEFLQLEAFLAQLLLIKK